MSPAVRRTPAGPQVLSAREFHGILRYERARADRSSGRFALVSLEPRALPPARQELQELIEALRRRARATDVLGWLDERTLSLLLPGADPRGAAAFAASLEVQQPAQYAEQARPAPSPPLPFTVFCYPDHWLHGENGNGNGHDAEFGRIDRAVQARMAGSLPPWKRALDVGAALVGLLTSAPLFLAAAAYIKVVSPGPVLFKQVRLGYRARPFTFLKFRTMREDNDPQCHQVHLKELIGSDRPMEKLDDGRDPRIIPGGRILRKICVDELPQLINVLRGEMSVVGPRPCLPYEAREYLRWHRNRFDVLPGLTGLWQVSGKNRLTFKQMIRLDIAYCRDMCLWLDVKILLRTVPTVIGLFFEGMGNRLRRRARLHRRSPTRGGGRS